MLAAREIPAAHETTDPRRAGTIDTVDVAISNLPDHGCKEVAEPLGILSQAVLDSSEIGERPKKDALDIIGAVSAETMAPKEQRRLAVVRPLFLELSNILQGVAALQALASTYIPKISAF